VFIVWVRLGLSHLVSYLVLSLLGLLLCGRQGFWRLYELTCPHMTCRILEEFVPDTFHLQPR
jgi:hypothetical protein